MVQAPVTPLFIAHDLVHSTLALTPRRTLFELLCESRMNLSDLEVPPPQQIQRTSIEATDKDADVRSFHLLTGLCNAENICSFSLYDF